MDRLQPLQQVTHQLCDLLAEKASPEARDHVIEKAGRLLEERDRLIPAVLPPYTSAEKETGQELIRLDAEIKQKMDELFTAIKADMLTVKKQKKSNASYANPYKQTTNYDGMFLDHKK